LEKVTRTMPMTRMTMQMTATQRLARSTWRRKRRRKKKSFL
jgi:hypothetical protein